MLPEVITFNKSMQYRLEEYQQLLDSVETPCAEISEIWASIFEEFAIMKTDWQALWMVSEETCRKYELLFPTAVIVKVNEFNWQNLSATAKILAVQEDIILPSLVKMPIIELHPIKDQEFDETELRGIEDWLDKCRYFFKNLWYPWDAKLDISMMDWCECHLKNRLKMQYDMKNGVLNKATIAYLKSLLYESQNINSIHENNSCFEEDDRLSVVKKYLRKKLIKAELDLFEEPDLRYGMILLKKFDRNSINSIKKIHEREIIFVWTNGSYKSFIHCLKNAESMIDENLSVRVCGSLQDALDSSNTDNLILISPGTHQMTVLQGINRGGTIKGLNRDECVILSDSASVARAILFECFGLIELRNLTISKPNGIAIQVFEGTLKIVNCKLTSKKHSSMSKGIVVISGSKIIIEDCELEGFGTALALQPGTHTTIKNTRIIECFEGIKVTGNNAFLSLQNVEISSCLTFGVRVESTKVDLNTPIIGDLSLLEDHDLDCTISTSLVKFNKNRKGDVVIKKSEKVSNFEEFSEADISSEVICLSDNSIEGGTNDI